MRRLSLTTLALAATVMIAAPAGAQLKLGGGGVEVMAPQNSATVAPPAVDGGIVTVRDPRKLGGQTLRCWQNGRLLYEGSGFRGNVGNPSAINIARRAEGEPVTVMNLQHALCILSEN
ncbi:MAG: hypothetical protein ABI790_17350 [Betaproteobacteria bacterium]